MMHSQQDPVFLRVESEQDGSKERPLCERKGVPSLLLRQATCERVSLGERKARQIDDREWQVRSEFRRSAPLWRAGQAQGTVPTAPVRPVGGDKGGNDLHWVSLPFPKCCTQGFMAL